MGHACYDKNMWLVEDKLSCTYTELGRSLRNISQLCPFLRLLFLMETQVFSSAGIAASFSPFIEWMKGTFILTENKPSAQCIIAWRSPEGNIYSSGRITKINLFITPSHSSYHSPGMNCFGWLKPSHKNYFQPIFKITMAAPHIATRSGLGNWLEFTAIL